MVCFVSYNVADSTYVLRNFQDQSFISFNNFDFEGVQNFRKLPVELDINDGSNNGGDLTTGQGRGGRAVSTDTRW